MGCISAAKRSDMFGAPKSRTLSEEMLRPPSSTGSTVGLSTRKSAADVRRTSREPVHCRALPFEVRIRHCRGSFAAGFRATCGRDPGKPAIQPMHLEPAALVIEHHICKLQIKLRGGTRVELQGSGHATGSGEVLEVRGHQEWLNEARERAGELE